MKTLSLECCAELIEKSKPCAAHLLAKVDARPHIGECAHEPHERHTARTLRPNTHAISECPDQVVMRMKNRFGLPVRDGENGVAQSMICIRFCPFCGADLKMRARLLAAVLQSALAGKRCVIRPKSEKQFDAMSELLWDWSDMPEEREDGPIYRSTIDKLDRLGRSHVAPWAIRLVDVGVEDG